MRVRRWLRVRRNIQAAGPALSTPAREPEVQSCLLRESVAHNSSSLQAPVQSRVVGFSLLEFAGGSHVQLCELIDVRTDGLGGNDPGTVSRVMKPDHGGRHFALRLGELINGFGNAPLRKP